MTLKRIEETFRLDLNKPQENRVWGIVALLKKERKYAYAIRVGLMLVWDFLQGRTDTLDKEFPWVREQLTAEVKAELDPVLLDTLNRIEAAIRAGGGRTLAASSPDPDVGLEMKKTEGGKGEWNNMIAMADLRQTYHLLPDDVLEYGIESGQIDKKYAREEPSIAIKKDTSSNPTWNNVISVMMLNNSLGDLPTEVLAYGLKKNMFSLSALSSADQKRLKGEAEQPATAPEPSGGYGRRMQVKEIAAPVYNDDDDDDLPLF